VSSNYKGNLQVDLVFVSQNNYKNFVRGKHERGADGKLKPNKNNINKKKGSFPLSVLERSNSSNWTLFSTVFFLYTCFCFVYSFICRVVPCSCFFTWNTAFSKWIGKRRKPIYNRQARTIRAVWFNRVSCMRFTAVRFIDKWEFLPSVRNYRGNCCVALSFQQPPLDFNPLSAKLFSQKSGVFHLRKF